MKTLKINQVLRSALIFIFSILFANNLFAQVVLPEVTVTSTTSSAAINEKVSKSFAKSFKETSNSKWFEINKRYLVKFISNDLKNQALFTKNGTLIYHIVYGYEKNLPANTKSLVKSKYFDYTITSAINVKQDQRDIWVVNLEDDKKYVIVRVEENEMQEIQNFNKASTELSLKGYD